MCIEECCIINCPCHSCLLLFKILPIFFDLKNIFYEILSNLTEGWTLVLYFFIPAYMLVFMTPDNLKLCLLWSAVYNI
jgi:hypothetical protein